jgi:hypothetical protein
MSRPAKAAPLPSLHREGRANAPLVAAVVFTVTAEVTVPPEVKVTLAGFKAQVGRLCAPAGEPLKVQVRFIVPEYVLLAVKVAVAVVLAPGETGGGEEIVMVTGEAATVAVPLEPPNVASPA